jgi:hypothetical protein
VRLPRSAWVDVGVKAAFVLLVAYGAFSGADQFEGKGFGWRLVAAPLIVLIVPALWALRGRPRPYPWTADALLTAPWLVDVLGNVFDLYDTVTWWDDANHLVNWALLCGGLGLLVLRVRLGALTSAALVVGFGAFLAVVWELGEYAAFIHDNTEELDTAYTDTLGDELLGTIGAVLAGAGVFLAARRRAGARMAADPPSPSKETL